MKRTIPPLAVVIPAYKQEFLADALRCLAKQTNKAFTVYIGDDCSPMELRPIVDSFAVELALHYHRFPNNIGSKNLVQQWARCVDLTQGEPWIWLFSDDDLASPNCVEEFYRTTDNHPSDVYRFNTCVIDARGAPKSPTLPSPDFESSESMAYHLLHWRRGNSMPDHIFSRAVYKKCGGFVYTPYAQGADWATSIRFSQDRGMRMMQKGLISWRQSGSNVSSTAAAKRKEVMSGHYAFIRWVLKHFSSLDRGRSGGTEIAFEQIKQAALYNLNAVVAGHYKGLAPSQYKAHVAFLRENFGLSAAQAWSELARLVFKTSAQSFRRERLAA